MPLVVKNVIARRFIEELGTGRNRPWLVQATGEDGSSDVYVVKPNGLYEMRPESSGYELLASLMGSKLSMNVFEPVFVNLTSEFMSTVSSNLGLKIPNVVGTHFGAVYHKGLVSLLSNHVVSPRYYSESAAMLLYDIMIDNVDRREDNSNCGICEGRLFVYDHESAFSFFYMLGAKPNPLWLIDNGTPASQVFNTHYFKNRLRLKSIDFESISTTLQKLDDVFWQDVSLVMPNDWLNLEKLTIIKERIFQFSQGNISFAKEVNNALSF